MSDYTHMKFEDVPDMAPQFQMEENLEARFARDPLGCQDSGVSLFRLKPGFRLPFGHKHAEQEETYVIVEGSGRMKVEDDVFELVQWDVVRIAPEPVRAFEAGPDGVVLVAFGAGPKGDGEMIKEWWTD